MIATRLILCLSLSAIGGAAQALESPDFNVTQQLLDLGVNVGALPELSNFVERRSATLPCAAAVRYLAAYPCRQGEAPYESFTGAYWSENQGEVDPYCIFKPANPSAISVLVLLSRLTQCPFAVKSGGHAAFAGASSIEGGITVSLEKINQVTLSSDKKTVVIGAGNRWSDVYRKLSKSDVTVTGGRVSSVGVGGLSLGGGISFFSNLHGWACDNVESYEVVTATGIILTASPKQNPNLYWALRGGGNNLGIVTNFTFRTIPLPGGQLWGGTKTFMEPALDAVVDAFAGMVTDSPQDPNAGLWVAWLKNSGLKLAATELWYAKPDGGSAAIFDAFNAIAPIADSIGNKFLPDYTDGHEASNPSGLREIYYGLTVKADVRLARLARDIFYDEYPAAEAVAGANPVMIFQAITTGQMARMRANGGNPLGLDAADGPLYLIHRLSGRHQGLRRRQRRPAEEHCQHLNRAPVTGTGYFSGLDA
ncbi:FAD binding domain-containing protein [Verticillium dahliae]|nr:FAD binding domain-containing protein [Verticillium dahliae]